MPAQQLLVTISEQDTVDDLVLQTVVGETNSAGVDNVEIESIGVLFLATLETISGIEMPIDQTDLHRQWISAAEMTTVEVVTEVQIDIFRVDEVGQGLLMGGIGMGATGVAALLVERWMRTHICQYHDEILEMCRRSR